MLEAFEQPTAEGGVGEIHLVYTEFVSMLTQRPEVRRILPLEVQEVEEQRHEGPIPPYEFEPSPQVVLDALLPWYVENRIDHALLESAAAGGLVFLGCGHLDLTRSLRLSRPARWRPRRSR